MFNNGQVWKYPQAGQWVEGRETLVLQNSMTNETVVAIPMGKIRKIGFGMKEVSHLGYHIYRNPKVTGPSEECDIIINDGVRIIKDDTGKVWQRPITIIHLGKPGDGA